ncbi:E4 [Equus caballus papillomavirus 9]|uniref:E4 n=1 Tax=Equus caballus papillomavirus 9 TaxID=2601244 RepID=A0A5B8K9B3_9PAPI|nr:E4 [Equus caballus papillomavirus 9]UXP87508.1 E4 protein [Equus caballus papillomavirus 9]UXP87515.1 E4 protein [Equus caballus papillomavirus 9]
MVMKPSIILLSPAPPETTQKEFPPLYAAPAGPLTLQEALKEDHISGGDVWPHLTAALSNPRGTALRSTEEAHLGCHPVSTTHPHPSLEAKGSLAPPLPPPVCRARVRLLLHRYRRSGVRWNHRILQRDLGLVFLLLDLDYL